MTDDEPAFIYGAGRCAVCRHRTRMGNLMCPTHWARVPVPERHAVYDALRRWDHQEGTLLDVRRAQARAVEAVTGERRYPTVEGDG
jgi:hypothetical protein